jgi:hypothetical protein
MWHYRMSGLNVASEIALPGALPRSDTGTNEVLIRRGTLLHALEGTSSRRQYLLRVPDVGRILIEDGQKISFDLDAGADERDAVVYMLGSAFGILLHQRGHLVLHASAVAVGSGAVIFCGPSRAGKSTLAAALVGQGYPFITDDVCHIGFDGARPIVFADGRMLKLWDETVENLALGARRGERVLRQTDKFYISPERRADEHPTQLAAIYILREADKTLQQDVEQLSTVEATALLRQNAYRPELLAMMDLEPQYFLDTMNLVSHTPVFYLTRSLGFTLLPQVVRELEVHWAELGLTHRDRMEDENVGIAAVVANHSQ